MGQEQHAGQIDILRIVVKRNLGVACFVECDTGQLSRWQRSNLPYKYRPQDNHEHEQGNRNARAFAGLLSLR